MAYSRFLLIAIIITIFHMAVIYTAKLPREYYIGTSQKYNELDGNDEQTRIKRYTATDKSNFNYNSQKRDCGKQACGWATYTPDRLIGEYMSSLCACTDPSYKCVRDDDDISMRVYVYRCRQNSSNHIAPEQYYVHKSITLK